jgi:hypothetical protein
MFGSTAPFCGFGRHEQRCHSNSPPPPRPPLIGLSSTPRGLRETLCGLWGIRKWPLFSGSPQAEQICSSACCRGGIVAQHTSCQKHERSCFGRALLVLSARSAEKIALVVAHALSRSLLLAKGLASLAQQRTQACFFLAYSNSK